MYKYIQNQQLPIQYIYDGAMTVPVIIDDGWLAVSALCPTNSRQSFSWSVPKYTKTFMGLFKSLILDKLFLWNNCSLKMNSYQRISN